MAIKRELTWAVAADGAVTPTTPLDGGVQGDHNQTRVSFEVAEESAWADPSNAVYIECEDGAGNVDTTEQLPVVNGKISYLFPRAWTQYGGLVTLKLVAEGPGVGEVLAYSSEARTRLESRQNAMDKVDGLMKGRLATMERRISGLADGVVQSADAATNAKAGAENAKAAAENAKAAAEKAAASVAISAEGASTAAKEAKEAATEIEGAKKRLPPAITDDDEGRVYTIVNGVGCWATIKPVDGNGKMVVHDDGEGNVTVEFEPGTLSEEEIEDLDRRLDDVQIALFGATESEPEPNPVVETVTVTNIIPNSQFATETTTGWEFSDTTASKEIADGMLHVYDITTANFRLRHRFSNQAAFVTGHRYYTVMHVKLDGGTINYTSATTGRKTVACGLSGSNTHETLSATPRPETADGVWHYLSSVTHLVEDKSTNYFQLFTQYHTDGRANANVYIDHAIVVDLTTAFGEGNEPDVYTMDRWMQEQYPNGFEGTATLSLTAEDSGEDDGEGTGLVGKVAALESDVANLKKTGQGSPVGDLAQTGTVYPALESHYIANIEAAKPEYYNAQAANTLTFAMLADIHASPAGGTVLKNVEASSAWAKLVNHDFVVLGGDLLNDSKNFDRVAALGVIDTVVELTEKHARCPVFTLKGNHDTNELATGNENRLTDAEFYIHANARGEKYGMVTDPAHPYSGYYYVDFPRQKIRMVCLNSSEDKPGVDIFDPNVDDGSFRYAGVFSTNQMTWIKDTALRVDAGWAVMMVSHIAPFKTDVFDNNDNTVLRALCEAFATGTGDFAEQGAREFIGYFCGHEHVDFQHEINGLNYVIVNCTFPHPKSASNPLYLARTENEDKLSLNSFIIDRSTCTVKCIKIGASPSADDANWTNSFTWNEVNV